MDYSQIAFPERSQTSLAPCVQGPFPLDKEFFCTLHGHPEEGKFKNTITVALAKWPLCHQDEPTGGPTAKGGIVPREASVRCQSLASPSLKFSTDRRARLKQDEPEAEPQVPDQPVRHQPVQDKLWKKVTTLMFCNIPAWHTADQLISTIEQHGFADTYDLLFLVSPKKTSDKNREKKQKRIRRNHTHAFINFKTEEDAYGFADVFKSYRWQDCKLNMLAYTVPANVQGFDANLHLHQESCLSIGVLHLPRPNHATGESIAWD